MVQVNGFPGKAQESQTEEYALCPAAWLWEGNVSPGSSQVPDPVAMGPFLTFL